MVLSSETGPPGGNSRADGFLPWGWQFRMRARLLGGHTKSWCLPWAQTSGLMGTDFRRAHTTGAYSAFWRVEREKRWREWFDRLV